MLFSRKKKQAFAEAPFVMPEGEQDRKMMLHELEIIKLREEIRQMQPSTKNGIEKLIAFLEKNIGYITTIFVLIAGVVNPVSNYIDDQRKAQQMQIASPLFPLFNIATDARADVKTSDIIVLASTAPTTVVPILLNRANHGKLHLATGQEIISEMYTLNREMSDQSFMDKILFKVVDDNTNFLEREIHDNAMIAFKKDVNSNSELYSFYLKIMFDVKQMNPEFDIDKPLDMLVAGCKTNMNANACLDAKLKFPEKFKTR